MPLRQYTRPSFEALESRRLLAAQLVADVNPGTGSLATLRQVELDPGRVLLWTDRGLWRSDGSHDGTVLIKNGYWDPDDSRHQFTNVNGEVFFTARQAYNEPFALWKSDGTTAGTQKLTHDARNYATLTNCNGTLYFTSANVHRQELWRRDAETSSIELVRDFQTYTAPSGITYYNGRIYFSVQDTGLGAELWSTDGTTAGTVLVKDIYEGTEGSSPSYITVANGLLYFSASRLNSGVEPWRSDGSSSGTFQLKEIASGVSSSSPREFTGLSGGVAFIANGILYRTDGTISGTSVLSLTSVSDRLVKAGDRAFFVGVNSSTGQDLWKTDGSRLGTGIVQDRATHGYLASLIALGTDVYFTSNDPAYGNELWKSDGTSAGTGLCSDLTPGPRGTPFGSFTASDDKLFFVANHHVYGVEPHVTDGTSDGTRTVHDINTTPISSNPGGPYPATGLTQGLALTATIGSTVFFGIDGELSAGGASLWKTDGTSGNTVRVKTEFGSGTHGPEYVRHLTAWDNAVYFVVDRGYGGRMWRSDGTTEGTIPLAYVDVGSPLDAAFVALGGALYFVSNSELWKTDGTAAGTVAVTGPGTALQSPSGLIRAGDLLYFTAWPNGEELWVSDGTAAGTRVLKSGTEAIRPHDLTAVGDTLFFTARATADERDRGLWKSDGTTAGTVELVRGVTPANSGLSIYGPANLTAVGDHLYFTGTTAQSGSELWQSDGTVSGTRIVKDISVGSSSSSPQWITSAMGRLYFGATTVDAGTELWTSDGTMAGTVRVADVNPGRADSMPALVPGSVNVERTIFAAGDGVFFAAADGTSGRELWHSGGTPGSTVRLADVYEGAAASDPRPMTLLPPSSELSGSPVLLFSAMHPDYGRELWRVAAPPTVVLPSWLAPGSAATWDAGSGELSVTGAATIIGDPGPDRPVIIANGAAAVLTINPVGATTQVNVTSLTLSGGATATLTDAATERVLVLHSGGVNINNAGSALNLTDNALLIDYTGASPYADIFAYAASGRAIGVGIVSTTAPAGDMVLAVAEQSDWGFTEFNGVAIDGTTIVCKYTYYGDANLDGKVTSDDYVAVDVGLGVGTSWVQGDFNFSGTVTSDDYVAIDVNLGKGSPDPLAYAEEQSAMIALHAEQYGKRYLKAIQKLQRLAKRP